MTSGPTLTLGPGPRGVQQARRWVAAACEDIGRPELIDCAELGTSELVTNALLHGAAPVEVRVRGTAEHPRLEVWDSSTRLPVLPPPVPDPATADDPGEALLTFGRGLRIVARAADAWGADVDEGGKVVWFAPAEKLSEGEGAEAILSAGLRRRTENLAIPEPVDVRLVDIPPDAGRFAANHIRELRREMRLLSLAGVSDNPFTPEMTRLVDHLDRLLATGSTTALLDGEAAAGAAQVDVVVRASRREVSMLDALAELLDLADELARGHRLLIPERPAAQVSFQRWLIAEFQHQADGAPPRPWTAANA